MQNIAGRVLGTKWNDTSSSPKLGFVRSVKTFLEQCSYGALTLNPKDNLVLTKPVPIRNKKICQAKGPVCEGNVDLMADEAEKYIKDVGHNSTPHILAAAHTATDADAKRPT